MFRKRSKSPKPPEPEFTITWSEPHRVWMLTRWYDRTIFAAYSASTVRTPIQSIACDTEAEAIERMRGWINAKSTAFDAHGQPIEAPAEPGQP